MATDGSSPQTNTEGKPPLCACCAPKPISGFPFFIPPFSTMLDAALIYAAHGWPIFPCQPINKVPYPRTHGFKDATTDPERIRRWWSRVPDSMIGIALGARSGIFAVDLDRKPGQPDGVATWAKLNPGGIPQTLSSTTPSTGQHHFFRHCCDLRNVELNGVAPGIEIKAEGGYVILPPSFCTDPKFNNGAGAGYRWNEPLIAPAEPPDWLVTEIICHNNPTPKVEEEPPWSDVPIERIEAALEAIDPDLKRDDWFHIGCTLYKQLGGYGLELWDEWSSKGRKYNAREMKGQRKSIAKAEGYAYTIGTLFYLASEADPDWDWEVRS